MAISKRKKQYLANKAAKCGDIIVCPICGTKFKKKQYSQAFCDTKCKDKFHNDRGDRHSDELYYSRYNMAHPERLDRIGLTEDVLMEIKHELDCIAMCDNPILGI